MVKQTGWVATGRPAPALAGVRGRLEVFERESSARSAELTRKVFGEPHTPARVVDLIVNDVRARGDHAVAEYTLKLDGAIITPDSFRVKPEAITAALRNAPAEFIDAIAFAASNVRDYQTHILQSAPKRHSKRPERWLKYSPVHSAACYVPGGLAPYMSANSRMGAKTTPGLPRM